MADNETLTNMQFLKTLFQLYIDTTLTKIPKINGKQLDFLRLFKEVRLHGGHKRVTTEKQWEKICERLFGEPLNRCGTTYVQALYNKMIIPYESQLEDFIASGSPQATSDDGARPKETGAKDSCGDEPANQPAPSQGPGEVVPSGSSPLLPPNPGHGPAVAASGNTPASPPESEGNGINCVFKPSERTSVRSVKNKCKLSPEQTNRKRVTKRHPPKLNLPSFSVNRNVEQEDYSPQAKMTRLLMDAGPEPLTPCHTSPQANGPSLSLSHGPSYRQAGSDTRPHWEAPSPRGAMVPSPCLQGKAQPTISHIHREPPADTERGGSHPDAPPVLHAFRRQPSPPGTPTPSCGGRPSFQQPDSLLHARHAGRQFDRSTMPLGSSMHSQKHGPPYSRRSPPQSEQRVLCPHSSQPHAQVYPDHTEHADQGYLRHLLPPQTTWVERWRPTYASEQQIRLLGPGESLRTTTGELYRANPPPYSHCPRSPCTKRPPWQSSYWSNLAPHGEAHPYRENQPYEYHLSHGQSPDRAQERPLHPLDPPDADTPLDLSLSCDRGSDAQPLCLIQSARNPGPRFLNEAQCVYQSKPSSAPRLGLARHLGTQHVTGCDRDSVDSLGGRGGSHLNMSDASPSPPLVDLTGSALYLDQSPQRDIDDRATPSPEADMRIKYLADSGPVWPRSLPTSNYVPEAYRFLARLLKIMPNYEPRFDSEPLDSLYIPQHRSGN